jgi:hypothetical protein
MWNCGSDWFDSGLLWTRWWTICSSNSWGVSSLSASQGVSILSIYLVARWSVVKQNILSRCPYRHGVQIDSCAGSNWADFRWARLVLKPYLILWTSCTCCKLHICQEFHSCVSSARSAVLYKDALVSSDFLKLVPWCFCYWEVYFRRKTRF